VFREEKGGEKLLFDLNNHSNERISKQAQKALENMRATK